MMKFTGNNQYSGKSMQERFWEKVDICGEDECWEWLAYRDRKGYGKFRTGQTYMPTAHRISWMLCRGDIPEGILVCHTCDNRGCMNPSHLFLGTNTDNLQDMVRKGRSTRGRVFHYGETHPMARLSDKEVDEILLLYSSGDYTYMQLSTIYNVTFQHIGALITGKRRNVSK